MENYIVLTSDCNHLRIDSTDLKARYSNIQNFGIATELMFDLKHCDVTINVIINDNAPYDINLSIEEMELQWLERVAGNLLLSRKSGRSKLTIKLDKPAKYRIIVNGSITFDGNGSFVGEFDPLDFGNIYVRLAYDSKKENCTIYDPINVDKSFSMYMLSNHKCEGFVSYSANISTEININESFYIDVINSQCKLVKINQLMLIIFF